MISNASTITCYFSNPLLLHKIYHFLQLPKAMTQGYAQTVLFHSSVMKATFSVNIFKMKALALFSVHG